MWACCIVGVKRYDVCMPKINATHILERLQEHVAKMERGEEVEVKKDKTLLSVQQHQALQQALAHQKQLKATHKRPKTQDEKDKLGWKEIWEVRLEIYRQAVQELKSDMSKHMRALQREREAKANRVFMDAWSKALDDDKDHYQSVSAGHIALTRAGFGRPQSMGLTPRDREIQRMEEDILKQLASSSPNSAKQPKSAKAKAVKKTVSKRKSS